MLDADQVAPLSSAQETLLRNQAITRDFPGTILRDVDTMLDLVGKLPIRPGTEMTYVYDFGDRWEFALTLDAVDPDDGAVEKPTILEAKGEPPEQYPDPDEWW